MAAEDSPRGHQLRLLQVLPWPRNLRRGRRGLDRALGRGQRGRRRYRHAGREGGRARPPESLAKPDRRGVLFDQKHVVAQVVAEIEIVLRRGADDDGADIPSARGVFEHEKPVHVYGRGRILRVVPVDLDPGYAGSVRLGDGRRARASAFAASSHAASSASTWSVPRELRGTAHSTIRCIQRSSRRVTDSPPASDAESRATFSLSFPRGVNHWPVGRFGLPPDTAVATSPDSQPPSRGPKRTGLPAGPRAALRPDSFMLYSH